MFAATIALFVLAAYAGMVQQLYWKQRQGALNTFIVDPPTMLVAGFLGVVLLLLRRSGRTLAWEEFQRRRVWSDRLLKLFFAAFITMEMLTYFNVLAHPYDAAKTGNDFMWNGYIDLLGWAPFDFAHPTYHYLWSYPFVIAMLALQWLCLRAGRALGYMVCAGWYESAPNLKKP